MVEQHRLGVYLAPQAVMRGKMELVGAVVPEVEDIMEVRDFSEEAAVAFHQEGVREPMEEREVQVGKNLVVMGHRHQAGMMLFRATMDTVGGPVHHIVMVAAEEADLARMEVMEVMGLRTQIQEGLEAVEVLPEGREGREVPGATAVMEVLDMVPEVEAGGPYITTMSVAVEEAVEDTGPI